ncbi:MULTISPECIES: hypothetical protein [unclassified Bradyrhizobium]|uniref:hypothetical protein n=1 Tax=unclassified Bradyrhizobium TaxID=2631580 RepID=UPI00040C751A|nr:MULTISPECIES: hypothetical protein [unclassified Bradyrhizobium]MCP3461157.1 hypothetical protein [Bradyrhizobium sp. CCGUVB23]
MAINKEWHRSHRMPPKATLKAATRAQRIEWHVAHRAACGCREIPASIRSDVLKLLRSRRKA